MEEWDPVPEYQPGKSGKPRMKKTLIVAISVIAVAVCVILAVVILGKPGTEKETDNDGTPSGDQRTEGQVSEPLVDDLDAYFSERGILLQKIPAATSVNTHTEAEAAVVLADRGFSQYPVTHEYDMDGTIHDETSVTAESKKKHPIYTTYYVTSGNEIWTLTEVNGTLTAYPVLYNFNSNLQAEVIIAETETIMSYDSDSGLFYETIPDPSVLIVKKVPRIDTETLERLTVEEIGKL